MEISGDPAPAIDLSTRLPGIIHHCLREGPAAPLSLDAQFMNARFRAHEIVRLIECASAELHMTLTQRAIAGAFNVDYYAIKRAGALL
jgi:hypothetical protein